MLYYKMVGAKAIMENKVQAFKEKCLEKCMGAKHPGIDGILVTVGLCIIALVLCVFMKEQMTTFIEQIVGDMTTKAQAMLELTTP